MSNERKWVPIRLTSIQNRAAMTSYSFPRVQWPDGKTADELLAPEGWTLLQIIPCGDGYALALLVRRKPPREPSP